MCQPNSLMLWAIQLLLPAVWVIFALWIVTYNNTFEDYAAQCDTSANIYSQNGFNCPTWDSYGTAEDCECIRINSHCEVAYNITNCIGSDWSCICQNSIDYETIIEVVGYTILTDILFFEFIKALIVWRLYCIISGMRYKPNEYHDPNCLKCGIKTLGNSICLRLIMCNPTGKAVVMYMYHRGMLLKNCGCCCIFFWQIMFGGALIFFYGYAFMLTLFTNIQFGNPSLWWLALIINSVWIILQFIYCISPPKTDDENVKNEIKKYNLPFVTDVISTGYVQPSQPQQIPLQVVHPQPVQPQVVYLQQQLANGQMVYVQQQPVPQQQQQQAVIMVPQPQPMASVASTSTDIGVTAGGGDNDYQVINPSAPVPPSPNDNNNNNIPNVSAPPPAMNPEMDVPPPAYGDYLEQDDDGGEGGGNIGPGQGEGVVTNM